MAKSEECECCGFATAELKEYRCDRNFPQKQDETKWICALCAGTMTGSFNDYPTQHDRDVLYAMKTICYVGNAILVALGKNAANSGEQK